jgi:hypothetical protein
MYVGYFAQDLQHGYNNLKAVMRQAPWETASSLIKGLRNGSIKNALIHSAVKNTITFARGNRLERAAAWGTFVGEILQLGFPEADFAKAGEISRLGTTAARAENSFAEGSFSVFNWNGYPTGGVKPIGPFRLLEDAEYQSARKLANSTNATMRRATPEVFKGLQIHEIHPVKFGGSPTDVSNKLFLTPSQHAQYTNFWNILMRSNK